MITIQDIIEMLNVTPMQVEMAMYSGRLPKFNESEAWTDEKVKPFIDNWKDSLERAKPRISNKHIETPTGTYSQHQR